MENQFLEEDEIIPLPENLGELAELIEVFAAEKNKAKYTEATTLYNRLIGRNDYSTTLKKQTKPKGMATKTATKKIPAKKAAKKAAPVKKSAALKKDAKTAPAKKTATKKTTIAASKKDAKVAPAKKAPTVAKEKAEHFIPIKPILHGEGKPDTAKAKILILYKKGKSVDFIMASGGYPKNTVLGAIFHAIRVTEKGVKSATKKK